MIESAVSPYDEGRLAFRHGRSANENPYPSMSGREKSNRRVSWFTGYYDERRWQKFGPNEDEVVPELTFSGGMDDG